MAKKNSFNIPALYKQVFGIAGVRFAIPELLADVATTAVKLSEFTAGQHLNQAADLAATAQNQKQLYGDIQTIPLPVSNIVSVLGTPIYEQISLTVPAVVKNGAVVSPQRFYTFPDWPLFDITASWMIEKENMQGGIGTTKEFIQQDDFQITIRGFLINNDSQDYPEQLLSDLWAVINAQKTAGALGITSRVFNLLDIHNIVILDAKFPAVEGYMNMQPFELTCLSDYTTILEIKSVKTQKAIPQGL